MKMIKEFEGIMPEIDESVFVAEMLKSGKIQVCGIIQFLEATNTL